MSGQWKTADFQPGDLLTFSMHTLHMSTTNMTNRARISADVRWQPAAEPADPRYVGDVSTYLKGMAKAGAWTKSAESDDAGRTDASSASVTGASEKEETTKVTMEQLRAGWGFPVEGP